MGQQVDWRESQNAAEAMAKAAEEQALKGAVAWISDITITYNTAVSLSLAPRTGTFAVPSAKAGDRVYVHRRARPSLAGVNVLSGIVIEGTGFVPSDGSVEIYHVIPAVGVGQTLLIPLRLVGFRPASI